MSQLIVIQPLGARIPAQDIVLVRQALLTFYGLPVTVLPRKPLPRASYYPPRRRWRAEKLLDFLQTTAPRGSFRVLGLTASDISTSKGVFKDWGVLGLATLDGKTCVISSFRCGRGVRTALEKRIRLAKVAVHEIGHTLGLDHCPVRGCLMEDARGSVKTCDREYDLCQKRCRPLLSRKGYRLPKPRIPWPKPS